MYVAYIWSKGNTLMFVLLICVTSHTYTLKEARKEKNCGWMHLSVDKTRFSGFWSNSAVWQITENKQSQPENQALTSPETSSYNDLFFLFLMT